MILSGWFSSSTFYARYLTLTLKDLLGETLQDMLNSEFDEHMGYDKYDQKTDKTNYRNGTSKKNS